MKLYTLSTGDVAYRFYKSILILFNSPRKVLSTSVLNGGYRTDLTAVFNHDCNPGAGMACTMKAPDYEGHLRIVSAELGVDPAQATGMATAASMDNIAIAEERFGQLTVTALVTGGVEVNGGRAGDPAEYYQPIEKAVLDQPGTINILLYIDADLTPGALTQALAACTEAKASALQELMAGSNYSSGLATGSGTDSTIIVANPAAAMVVEKAGNQSQLGELTGRAVTRAVKEALFRQSGLSPERQYSVLKRLKRYGINEEELWLQYRAGSESPVAKALFMDELYQLDKQSGFVIYTSLYVHLLDQLDWGLLGPREVQPAAVQLLELAARLSGAPACPPARPALPGLIAAWRNMLVKALDGRLQAAGQTKDCRSLQRG